jgi:iron complex outermembrane receptor protein
MKASAWIRYATFLTGTSLGVALSGNTWAQTDNQPAPSNPVAPSSQSAPTATGSGAPQQDAGITDSSSAPTAAPSEQASQPSATPAADTPAAPSAGTKPPPSPQPGGQAAGVPQAPADSGNGIETVVVTARRSAESMQKVPVAITAFSDKDLQREQIGTAQDLAGRVPSLVVSSNSNTRNTETPTIRGQGATTFASPGVVIYYGEVPLPLDQFNGAQGGPGKFFDLANLQILKGSQGTLFGRNTTGGALLLEPHKPEAFYSASVKAETSNLQGKGLESIVNLPLVDDQLYLRVGAKFYERQGFTKDVVTGEEYDSKAFRTFRLGLMWKPTDSIQNYLLGYYTRSTDNGTSQVLESVNNTGYLYPGASTPVKVGCVAMALAGSTYSDCGQSVVAAQQARGPRNVELSNPPNDILDTQALIESFSYQISDALTLRDIASYSLYKSSFRWDVDGSTLTLNDIGWPNNTNSSDTATYTEELQLQGNFLDRSLKLVEGAYYEYMEPEGPEENLTRNLGITSTAQTYQVKHRTYGPYAQGTYNFGNLLDALEGLNFTMGARYSVYDESGTADVTTDLIPGSIQIQGGTPHSSRVKSEAPTYTAGFDYKIPTTLLYAKISRGYKSGGFSAVAVNPANYTFKPEFVMNYEVGHKSDFTIGDMPVRINSALYYTDYTNMQRTAGDSYKGGFGGATYNAGKATIMGFETDTIIQPFHGFMVSANYSYTYGKYDDFTLNYSSTYDLPIPDCTGKIMQNGDVMHLECVPFQYAPKHQASGTVRYQLPLNDSIGQVDASATYSFTDRQYSSATSIPSEEPGAWLGAYGLLNASVTWSNVYRSAFDLQLFGTNLTDRLYRMTNSNQWNVFFFQSSVYGEPRVFGISLNYHWDK